MDFDLDDPLGDLLSDGSNDSFFGATKLTKKKPTETGTSAATVSRPTTAGKSKMEHLFGIEPEKVEEKAPDTISQYSGNINITSSSGVLTLNEKKPLTPKTPLARDSPLDRMELDLTRKATPQTPKTPALKKDFSFGDSDDILSELGFDPKKPKGAVKKTSIFDDLMGTSEMKSAPTTTAPIRDIPKTPPRRNAAQRQPEAEIGPGYELGSVRSTSRPSTAMPRSQNAPSDPLGLFSSTATAIDDVKNRKDIDDSRPKLTKKPSMVDWLGLDAGKETEPPRSEATHKQSSTNQPIEMQQMHTATTNEVNNDVIGTTLNVGLLDTIRMIGSAEAESAAALKNLQNQESQLHIATQMRNQESALLDMQQRQQSLLRQQEANFNDLLRRQLSRQNALEDSIRRQQEQINSHIKLLMLQPAGVGVGVEPATNVEASDMGKSSGGDLHRTIVELEAELKKADLEKVRLQDLLQNVRSNHEQEMDLIDLSHRKQIQTLEENLANLETRLRNEKTSIEEYYGKKMSNLSHDLEETISKYTEEKRRLIENNDNTLQSLRKTHENELDVLRAEHQTMIQKIRESKLLEFAVVQENGSYLATLKRASSQLENASENFHDLRDEMREKIDRLHREREIQLEAKEKRLDETQSAIERSREATESERMRLLELVKTLESKLNSVEQSSTEEQWSLRQQRNSLETEKASFEREKEFIREKQLADEKRIQDLRNQQLIEHKHLMSQLDEERNRILLEKTKLETMSRLNMHSEPNTTTRAEIEAAIMVAKEAAQQADTERNLFVEKQRSLDDKRRDLFTQEQAIRSREAKLESSISQTESRKHEAELAIQSAKMLEQKMLLNLHHLQRNFREFSEREAKLSQEKLDLSKERIELQALRKRLFSGRCSLCKIGEKSKELSNILTNVEGLDTDLLAYESSDILHGIDMLTNGDILQNTFGNLDGVVDASLRRVQHIGRPAEIDLTNIPEITDISDNLLDPDLQMVKLDALQTKSSRHFAQNKNEYV